MKTSLLELLLKTKVVHPTRIVAVEAGHRQLRVTIAGNPWWRTTGSREEDQIVFSFEGIEEGLLDTETLLDIEEDEALEFLRVSPLSEQDWADDGTSYSMYCSESLPHPLHLYAAVEDHLWKVGAPRTARDYLNVPDGSLAGFCALTQSRSFLVARAPERLHAIITTELLRQNVTHNVIPSERSSGERPSVERFFVQIGGTNFVCLRATAEV